MLDIVNIAQIAQIAWCATKPIKTLSLVLLTRSKQIFPIQDYSLLLILFGMLE